MALLDDIKKLYKKLEPFIAFLIIGLLISVAINLPKQIKLNEEIKETCGWENEKVRCICEKNYVTNQELIKSGLIPSTDNFNLNESTEEDV